MYFPRMTHIGSTSIQMKTNLDGLQTVVFSLHDCFQPCCKQNVGHQCRNAPVGVMSTNKGQSTTDFQRKLVTFFVDFMQTKFSHNYLQGVGRVKGRQIVLSDSLKPSRRSIQCAAAASNVGREKNQAHVPELLYLRSQQQMPIQKSPGKDVNVRVATTWLAY